MNYTQNHHLPQWVKSDRIMMDDFNQAMSKLESSLTANAQAAANAQSAASQAQSTANTARTEAAAKPYVTGSYTGTGADLTINLGFRPSFLLISGMRDSQSLNDICFFGACSCMTGGQGDVSESHLRFTSSGVTVLRDKGRLPDLTENGRLYEYIAFK